MPGLRLARGTILGSYRVDDVLGEGGMGVVYLAVHARLDRRVAIKVLRSEYASNPQARHRFFGEARAINKISHPHVIEIIDFVEDEGAQNFYVMELLEGASLADLVQAGGTLPLLRTIAIMEQIAAALAVVHRAGIVHRDLKPHNVLLIERGGRADFVKLVDFGIAKLVDVDEPAPDPSAPILGTPKYMSPEQARGDPVDHRSDIYAFGVMLYELATSRMPLAGADQRELLRKLQTVAPIPPSQLEGLPHDIPPSLETLMLECLAKDRNDRPDDMEIVAARLGLVADEHDGWQLQLGLNRRQQLADDTEVTRINTIPAPPSVVDDDPVIPPPIAEAAPPPSDLAAASLFSVPAPRHRWPIVVAVIVAVVIAIVVAISIRTSGGAGNVASKVEAEIAIADQRIAAGRFVASGGDEALDHLIAARTLDPANPAVRERLQAIARRFEKLATEALATGSLEEAAAHFQTVLAADPAHPTATAAIEQIEARIVARQRAALPNK